MGEGCWRRSGGFATGRRWRQKGLGAEAGRFYAYFGQNKYFKAITHQLNAFKISLNVINRINEVQVLYYSYICN